jgi:hypothetical protein
MIVRCKTLFSAGGYLRCLFGQSWLLLQRSSVKQNLLKHYYPIIIIIIIKIIIIIIIIIVIVIIIGKKGKVVPVQN